MLGPVYSFSPKMFARKVGNSMAFFLNGRIVQEIDIKEKDYVLPCIIDSAKRAKDDPVIGKRDLIFIFKRNVDGKKLLTFRSDLDGYDETLI